MEVVSICSYSGRNIYSHKPVVKMIVDLGDLAEKTTNEIEGFNDKLLSLFPGLYTHHCSVGYSGGFVERLTEGTLLSHVTEHLALELQCIIGYDVYFGKTRVIEEPYLYGIVYEYINTCCAKEFGYAAAEIISALASKQTAPVSDLLDRLYQIAYDTDLGPSTQAIFDEARRRNIPVRRLGNNSLLQLGYGCQARFIQASLPDATSTIAVDLAKNKQLAKELLREQRIPVPDGGVAETEDAAVVIAEQLHYPVVVKPFDANQGRGVTAAIGDEKQLRSAFHLARLYTERVIIEKYIKGRDYRILVVGDQVVAVAERKPPTIVGDGVHTIAELVDQENQNSNRGDGHAKPLTKIHLDEITTEYLARAEYRISDVPPCGEIIRLRENGNLSTGGSARDCTAEIHPRNKEIAVKAAKIIGLEVAGIDIVIDNISRLLTTKNGAIIEINAAPGLRMHLEPAQGTGKNVAAAILDHMYPTGTNPSIPIVSITGTNGKTTVTRLIRHVLMLAGKKAGMTCSTGTYIGDECISQGDNTGPVSAQSILYDTDVEFAVLETARGGIVRKGLGYDLADVGVIVNVSDDHLGMDGINTIEDLAFVKALVVEAVKPDGYAVLNADDGMTDTIIPKVSCNMILFSQNHNNLKVRSHINQGKPAVIVESGEICIYNRNRRTAVIGVDEIPITFDGKAVCNIENSLAATAGLFALGIGEHTIRLGLMSFKPDPVANAGRFNLFDLGDFRVLLDYGHNLSGYQCVSQFVKSMHAKRLVGVIGMPGDRRDSSILEVGKISGQVFSKIYIKEDKDLRGREPGETSAILREGVLSADVDPDNIEIIFSEIDALQNAIDHARDGDLIVMFYEDFESAYNLILEYGGDSGQLNFQPEGNTDYANIPEAEAEYLQ